MTYTVGIKDKDGVRVCGFLEFRNKKSATEWAEECKEVDLKAGRNTDPRVYKCIGGKLIEA